MKLAQVVIEALEKKNFKYWYKWPNVRLYYNGTADKAYYDLISEKFVCDNPQTIETMKSIIEQEVKKHQDRMRLEQMRRDLSKFDEHMDVEFTKFLIETVPSADYSNFIKAGIFDTYSYWSWTVDDDVFKQASSYFNDFDKKAANDANAAGIFNRTITTFISDYRNSGRVAQTLLDLRDQFGFEEKLESYMKEQGFDEEEIRSHLLYSDHEIRNRIRSVDAFGHAVRELDFGVWEDVK